MARDIDEADGPVSWDLAGRLHMSNKTYTSTLERVTRAKLHRSMASYHQ
jgi:hypothetical protein